MAPCADLNMHKCKPKGVQCQGINVDCNGGGRGVMVFSDSFNNI